VIKFLFFSEAHGLLDHLQELSKGSCDTGELRKLLLYSNGKANDEGCGLLPQTCALIGSISTIVSCKTGEVLATCLDVWVHLLVVCVVLECFVAHA